MNPLDFKSLAQVAWLLLTSIILIDSPVNGQEFELKDQDRVVLIGSEFIEQQIKHNFLEAALTLRWRDRNIKFRNLGWAGDTPTAISRGYFGGQEEGFRRLLEELDRIDPTVVFLCYGANSDVDSFQADFARLYGEVKKRTKRIVVVSHPAAETLHRNIDVSKANEIRLANASALKQFVDTEKLNGEDSSELHFVDLFSRTSAMFNKLGRRRPNMTTDAIRYHDNGYKQLASEILSELGMPTMIREGGGDEFTIVRRLIKEKNDLYFHRYRPQNETYLRGFRKHEQGQNAKEIAEFDVLIDAAEQRLFGWINGQPLPKPVADPVPTVLTFEAFTPEEEQATFTLDEGLEINLFASEPMIANPIHMNFDSRGRLWVATSPVYPQIKPGAKPSDQIIILEDTDGDGRADKRTVFADDLLIPTAVLPDEQGGAYVANSTEILHLYDENRDGKSDYRKTVLAGFGTEDTHHIVHTLRWGPDAAIYFNQSIYIHTHMETPYGVKRLMGSGIWRFDPQTKHTRVQMRGLVNPWGHVFDEWGQSFATDGAGGDGINYAFPTSAYPTAVGFSKVLRGMNPGQPKHCGLEIFSGSHFSDEWKQSLVTSDFRGNRINRFQLSEEGSGYTSRQLSDLMSSNHRAFRPVDLKMSPDGTLYVADWYNPIINHGEVDFRDSRRDYKHGRIWRVKAKGKPVMQRAAIEGASVEQLVGLMRGDEEWSQVKARLELKRRVSGSRERYESLLQQPLQQLFESGKPQDQLAALWTIEAVGQLEPESIKSALKSTDHHVRAATVRILANQPAATKQLEALVLPAANDVHPQVRLEFVNAWRNICGHTDIEPLKNLLDQPTDKYIEFAVGNALKDFQSEWLPDFDPSEFDSKSLRFIVEHVSAPKTLNALFDLLNQDSPQEVDSIVKLIADRAGKSDLKRLYDIGTTQVELREPVLNALVMATRKRKIKLDIDADSIQAMFDSPNAIRLAGEAKLKSLNDRFVSIASNQNAKPVTRRVAAVQALAAIGNFEAIETIASDLGQPTLLRRVSIAEYIRRDAKKAATMAFDFMDSLDESNLDEAQSLADVFLNRKQGGQLLANAFANQKISNQLRDTLLSRASTKGKEGKTFADAIRVEASLNSKTKMNAAEIAAFVETVNTKGDPARGELIYRRPKLNCITCHAIGGAGGVVGPDMISLGASSPVDYIVESLIDPNAKIKEGFHTTTILTVDGVQVSGKLMSEVDGKLVLRDANDETHRFDDSEIEDQKISPVSLMPADTIAALSESELVDLVAFLSSLGKEGPFKVSNERFVRRWESADGKQVTTKVDGTLLLSEVRGRTVSCQINVTQAGSIGLHVEDAQGLRITLGDMKDNLRAERIVTDLPQGVHRFTFQFNPKNRQSLRARLFDVEGTTGKADFQILQED